MDLLQEVKSCASSLKQQDSELSSDDHDGKEDL